MDLIVIDQIFYTFDNFPGDAGFFMQGAILGRCSARQKIHLTGLGAAIDYLTEIGLERVHAYEQELLDYGTERLSSVPGIRLIGTAPHKSGVISFVMEGVHPHDIGTILDHEGIAVRTGHHCAQPVMDRFGVPATVRASMSIYNTKSDLDALIAGLEKVRQVFR